MEGKIETKNEVGHITQTVVDQSASDSVVLKKGAKGDYTYEIKVYNNDAEQALNETIRIAILANMRIRNDLLKIN